MLFIYTDTNLISGACNTGRCAKTWHCTHLCDYVLTQYCVISHAFYEATRFKSILSLLSLEISIERSLTTQRSDLGFYAAC